MVNVLVTGGKGQLATCIKDIEGNYNSYNFIYTDHEDLDICKVTQLETFFNVNKINYCINCAAYTAVDKAELEPEKAYQINVEGTNNLATVCVNYDVVLIHISTDFVFEGDENEPYSEEDVAKPINVYGKSKLQGEQEIKKVLDTYFIIRTSWLYSEHGNNFLKTMLRLSNKRDEISVVNDQIGTPTYAKDLARIIMHFISKKNKVFGTYHYSNNGTASWFDFANAIFEYSNLEVEVKPIPSEEFPQEAKRPRFSVLDKKKIQKKLEIRIPSWKSSLKKCLANL